MTAIKKKKKKIKQCLEKEAKGTDTIKVENH